MSCAVSLTLAQLAVDQGGGSSQRLSGVLKLAERLELHHLRSHASARGVRSAAWAPADAAIASQSRRRAQAQHRTFCALSREENSSYRS